MSCVIGFNVLIIENFGPPVLLPDNLEVGDIIKLSVETNADEYSPVDFEVIEVLRRTEVVYVKSKDYSIFIPANDMIADSSTPDMWTLGKDIRVGSRIVYNSAYRRSKGYSVKWIHALVTSVTEGNCSELMSTGGYRLRPVVGAYNLIVDRHVVRVCTQEIEDRDYPLREYQE
jgi:hypothetical protein